MSGVIVFAQSTDNHSFAGTGMNEFPIFEIDTYVSYLFSGTATAEEYQIAFSQIPFGDFGTFFSQVFGISRNLSTVYFPVYLVGESRTVGTAF